MTRQEFIDDICDMDDLYRVCSDADVLHLFECYYDASSFDERVEQCLCEDIPNVGWREAVGYFYNEMPDYGYSWYFWPDDGSSPTGVGDYEFENLKSEVLEYLDDGGYFDEEYDEYQEPEPQEEEEEEDDRPDFEDDIDFMDFTSGNDEFLGSITEEPAETTDAISVDVVEITDSAAVDQELEPQIVTTRASIEDLVINISTPFVTVTGTI